MIIFDKNKSRANSLKKAIRANVCKVSTAHYYNDETKCIEALDKSEDIITIMWIGTNDEYLINWIISMEPMIQTIVIYDETNKDEILRKLHMAKYKASFVDFSMLMKRLNK